MDDLPPDDDAIISLDAYRIRREQTTCRHPQTVIDRSSGTITCRTCGAYLSAFMVLLDLAGREGRWWRRVQALKAEVDELKAWNPGLRAVRALEKLWRGRRMLPTCKHCGRGLWPQELDNGTHVGVRYEVEIRRQRGIAVPEGVDINAGMTIVGGIAMGPKDHAE